MTSLLGLLWPHYLRPVPSMTIVQFIPGPEVDGRMRIARGISIDSAPVEERPCRFRTAYDVDMMPMELVDATLEAPLSAAHALRMRFRTMNGVDLKKLKLERVRFHIYGDPHISYELYLRLRRHVSRVTVSATDRAPSRKGSATSTCSSSESRCFAAIAASRSRG